MRPGDYPSMDMGDGRYASHLMSSGEADGRYFAYPTVRYEDGKLKRYEDREAFDRAMATGDYIEFDSSEKAERFGREYKRYWDKGRGLAP